jgi:hypothetical protein
METDVDYAGHDLQPVQGRAAADPQACCALCATVPACKFWTWQSAAACYLKDSMAGSHAYPGATSGTSGTPGPPGPPAPPNPGSNCTAFTWHDKTQGAFALMCALQEGAHVNTWKQGSAEPGHYSGICNHAARSDSGSREDVDQTEAATLQSYGGVMRSPMEWPVPGQGNGRYPRGAVQPAAGLPRSQGLQCRRKGVPEIPAAASLLYVDYGVGSDTGAGSKADPLKTIAAALAKSGSLPAPRTIFLTGSSTHYLKGTVRLTASHSRLTIASLCDSHDARECKDAVVSGGALLDTHDLLISQMPSELSIVPPHELKVRVFFLCVCRCRVQADLVS